MVPGVKDGHSAPETVKPVWDGGTSVSYARDRLSLIRGLNF